MMNEKMFEKIENYLNGPISSDEKKLFELEMSGNEELASAYQLYKSIEEEMRTKEKLSEAAALLKSTLDKTRAGYFKSEPAADNKLTNANEVLQPGADKAADKISTSLISDRMTGSRSKVRRMNQWTSIAVAAVILGVIALGITWYVRDTKEDSKIALNNKAADSTLVITDNKEEPLAKNNLPGSSSSPGNNQPYKKIPPPNKARQSESNKALFARNFKPDATPQNEEGLLEEPLNFYADKNYKDAIETFEMAKAALETRGSSNSNTKLTSFNTHYYLALSYMTANLRTANAISNLKYAISNSPDAFLQAKAEWYLALAYLKLVDVKKAAALLKKISVNNNAGEYRQKAIHLLNEMNRQL
ncbi:MAG: hypothetical protein WKF91_21720 [Segetibacter sp.]